MPRLILLNGAPGSGKSTLARLLADRMPRALVLSIDDLKHSLGQWQQEPSAAKTHARSLGIALVREQLGMGYDVILAQYCIGPSFIEEVEADAADLGATFHEIVLMLPPADLAARLAERVANPSKTSREINNRMVLPADAPDLAASIDALLRDRPRAHRVDGRGAIEQVLDRIVDVFEARADEDE